LDRIVLDELHLLLRIGDVLLRNLILEVDSIGHRRREHNGEESNGIRELEEAVRACGVSFQIRQNREPTGKPIPGSYDFTALSGKFKLQVMRKLPAKFDTILPGGLGPQVAQLWNVSVIYKLILYIEFIMCVVSPIRTFCHSILLFRVPHHPQLMCPHFMRRYFEWCITFG
jgi:hypothetical protein